MVIQLVGGQAGDKDRASVLTTSAGATDDFKISMALVRLWTNDGPKPVEHTEAINAAYGWKANDRRAKPPPPRLSWACCQAESDTSTPVLKSTKIGVAREKWTSLQKHPQRWRRVKAAWRLTTPTSSSCKRRHLAHVEWKCRSPIGMPRISKLETSDFCSSEGKVADRNGWMPHFQWVEKQT